MIIDIEIMYLIYFSSCFYILSASMMQTLMPWSWKGQLCM